MMSELIARIDLVIVVLYLLGTLGIAFVVSSKSRDVEGYTVGNRGMAGWVIGLSVLGTFTSSITFLGLPAKTYLDGNWNAYVFTLSLPLAAVVAVQYFVPLYRRGVRISAYELLERRFGYWARAYANLSYIGLQLGRIASVLLLVAMAVSPLLDLPIVPTLIILGTLVIIYDTLGGIQAVIWTDVLQVFVLLGGAIWCLAQLAVAYPGGPAHLWESVPAGSFSLGPVASWDLAQSTVLVILIYGITENLRNYGTDQSYVQRLLAAHSDRAAGASIWIGALSYVPVSFLFCMIGTALAVQFPLAEQSALTTADQVFPYFIKYELPGPVTGLVVAAILAAAMSTVDSSLNASSTVLYADVIQRLRLAPDWVPGIYILRGATIVFGVLGTAGSVLLFELVEETSTIMDAWWQFSGIAGGGMFGLFLVAWLMPRLPAWLAAVGVVLTLPVLAWGTFARGLGDDSAWQWLECPLHKNLVGVSATLVLLLVAGAGVLAVRGGLIAGNPRSSATP